ncbi:MAG: asparagine synthetase B, partial [Thaumarchaeota archaeon]|nr:asparagine synthetase B [Nitrososphaerota archaeon]
MCGIAGIVDKHGGNVLPALKTMLTCIRHRGPDGYGFSTGGVTKRVRTLEELDFQNSHGERAIGHARLAIVGGESGIQPLEGCGESLVILHNGEIYNHKKLKKELEKTHRFETFSDSETIVHLLEENYNGNLGEALAKTLPELDGEFAIAALDSEGLAIARDVMGV